MDNAEAFAVDGATLLIVGLIVGVLLLLILVNRLLSDRKSLREEIVSLASRINDSQNELSSMITNFTIEFRAELRAHDQRIREVENVHRRWGGGHLIDRDIESLKSKTSEHDEWAKTMRQAMTDIRNTVRDISVKVSESVGEVKEVVADLKARVETWETCLKESKIE